VSGWTTTNGGQQAHGSPGGAASFDRTSASSSEDGIGVDVKQWSNALAKFYL